MLHYLSNTSCLIRPRLCYALLTVPRIAIICKRYSPLLKKVCVRQVVLDKWFPLNNDVYTGVCKNVTPLAQAFAMQPSGDKNSSPPSEVAICKHITGLREREREEKRKL